jgi:DNA repair protein RadD
MAGQVLRDYQVRAHDDLRGLFRLGRDAYAQAKDKKTAEKLLHFLLVASVGAGKTTIAKGLIESAVRKAGRIVFVAHTNELIEQASNRLDEAGIPHGIMMGQHDRTNRDLPVQVCSIQTLSRRDMLDDITLIIVDECHRIRADSYQEFIAQYPGVPVIGLSASPWRTDGKGLGEFFGHVVVAATPAELIRDGWLVPYDGFAFKPPDLKGVRKIGGEYNQEQLDRAVRKDVELAGSIVEHWLPHKGKRTLVFCVSIAHSKETCERFLAAGARAEHLDGETPKPERAAILARFKSGATDLLTSCNLLTEGFDEPRAEVGILARPTASLPLSIQMPGRLMRPACMACGGYAHPKAAACPRCGAPDIKRVAILHDHAGIFRNPKFGLPDRERDYSLEQDKPPKPQLVKSCAACYAAFVGSVCPKCGLPVEEKEGGGKRREIVEVEAVKIPLKDLVKAVGKEATSADEYYAGLLKIASERGYKKGWAGMTYARWLSHGGPKRLKARAG